MILTFLHNLTSLWLHSFYLEVINHNCFILITALFLIVWLVKKKEKKEEKPNIKYKKKYC